jgi:Arc/MetJ-type ribon-helix-helix transcriptional regulator
MQESPIPLGRAMPPRKPLNDHKLSMTVSIDPSNRRWIRENYQSLNYRSESHLVDEAVSLLREKTEREKRERTSERTMMK